MTYVQRLRHLQLPSLKYRRMRGDMTQTFKIMKGIDDIDRSYFFESNKYDRTRNTGDKIFIKHSKTNTRKLSFSRRVAPLWNTKLTQSTKLSTNKHFQNTSTRKLFLFKTSFSLMSSTEINCYVNPYKKTTKVNEGASKGPNIYDL